jgi:hypothetical protein
MKSKSYDDFLDYSVTNQENSVEIYFCKPLDEKGKKGSMNDEESRIMITLLMTDDPSIDKMYDEIYNASHLVKILVSRAEYAGLKIDKRTAIMLGILCKSPGQAVMYVYYLMYKAKTLKKKEITFDTLCKDIFPFGFFTEDTLNYYWDEQKVKKDPSKIGTDNLLDYSEASKSLIQDEIK